jgi:uncharacterized membrane protein
MGYIELYGEGITLFLINLVAGILFAILFVAYGLVVEFIPTYVENQETLLVLAYLFLIHPPVTGWVKKKLG